MGQQAVARGQGVERQILRNAPLVQNQGAVEEMLHILDVMGREQQRFLTGQVALISLRKSRRVKGSLPRNGSSIR